ncbi:MAG TPA: hypothetical protein VN700_14615 [Vicinamibacterales bacterium]|nr:hypothetical protein [Vicinamibacterales bacterium]
MNPKRRLLVILLRLGGVATASAFLAILLPRDWMASTHEWLGLGEFPRAPVVDYLARSVAALYGFHGVFLLIVSRDVVRFRPLVTFIGILNLAFGLIVTAIDLHAPMPTFWTLVEGPPIALFGVAILYLRRSVPAPAQ